VFTNNMQLELLSNVLHCAAKFSRNFITLLLEQIARFKIF